MSEDHNKQNPIGMERLVRHLTEQVVKILPEDKEYFTPGDLREHGVLEFIVQRVEVEMNKNLSESIVPPETDWADMSTEQVQKSWENFIEAIVEEVRMPASYLQPVLENSLSDIIDVITKPRMSIPMIIFGEDNELDLDTLRKRSQLITVNTHLVTTLLRYMEKKEKATLIRQECEAVIERIDQSLISNYNALNWAQMLEPLFKLNGPAVDTNLFRVFFEEKGMLRVARKFDMMNTSLTKSEFIEVLSSPYLLNVDGDEEEQATLFEIAASKDPALKMDDPEKVDEPEESPAADETREQLKKLGEEFKKMDSGSKNKSKDTKPEHGKEEEEDKSEAESAPAGKETDEDTDGGSDPLIAKFHKRRKIFGVTEDGEFPDEDETPLHQRFAGEKSEEKKSETEKPADKSTEEQSDEEFTLIIDEDDDETDSPMWKAFLEREDTDAEDALFDEAIIRETIAEEEGQESLKEQGVSLYKWLADDRARFVSELFGGSEEGFEEAIYELSDFDDWKNASRYIEKEIFSRNLIDMYDEIAVDFTDRLHTFFIEYKKPLDE